MTGLFLNFAEVILDSSYFQVQSIPFQSSEELTSLREGHPDKDFWRARDNQIYFWNKAPLGSPIHGREELIYAKENAELYRIILFSLLKAKLTPAFSKIYKLGRTPKTQWWTLTSLSDLLEERIPGLCLQKQAVLSPYHVFNTRDPIFGFLISFRVKHSFTYGFSEFEANSIDPSGIKFIEGRAVADKKSLEYFLQVSGQKTVYQEVQDTHNVPSSHFTDTRNLIQTIRKLEGKSLCADVKVNRVRNRLIPHSEISSIQLSKPIRYYWNLNTPENKPYYDVAIRNLRPYSYDSFLRLPNKEIVISVLTPAASEGIVETFVKKLVLDQIS